MAAIPSWLDAFLAGNYFAHCRSHVSSKNERNHFCVDCCAGPLCHAGLQQDHPDHTTLQVRRASHMDAVRISDIHKLVDTSGIQPYTINGAKIVFLLSRPQSRLARCSNRCCQSCGRGISDAVRFCSISCKLACAVGSCDDSIVIVPRKDPDTTSVEDDQSQPQRRGGEGGENATIVMKRRREELVREEQVDCPPPILGFKRSKLQIIVKGRDRSSHELQHQQFPALSPDSVLPAAVATAAAVSPTQWRNVVLVSTPSPRSHRKGTPHRSPLF